MISSIIEQSIGAFFMSVSPIPEGFHSLTPYLIVKGAVDALAFYQKALNAEVKMVLNTPDGGVAHAELMVGNSYFMLSEEHAEMGMLSPETVGGNPVNLMLYVENVDDAFSRAIDAGCTEIRPVSDQFYGDRSGTLKDPFGHTWTLGTQIEKLTVQEIEARMMELFGQGDS